MFRHGFAAACLGLLTTLPAPADPQPFRPSPEITMPGTLIAKQQPINRGMYKAPTVAPAQYTPAPAVTVAPVSPVAPVAPAAPVTPVGPGGCSSCGAQAGNGCADCGHSHRNCWERFWEWLCYKPITRCYSCCPRPTPYRPPLYAWFPCEGKCFPPTPVPNCPFDKHCRLCGGRGCASCGGSCSSCAGGFGVLPPGAGPQVPAPPGTVAPAATPPGSATPYGVRGSATPGPLTKQAGPTVKHTVCRPCAEAKAKPVAADATVPPGSPIPGFRLTGWTGTIPSTAPGYPPIYPSLYSTPRGDTLKRPMGTYPYEAVRSYTQPGQ